MIPNILRDARTGAVLALLILWAGLTFSTALVEIAFVAALILWAWHRIQARRILPETIPVYAWLLGAFVLWCSLSLIWSDARPQSLRGFFKIAQQVLLFFIIVDILRDRARGRFEITFLAIATLITADGLFQYFTGRDFIRGFAPQHASSGYRIMASFKTYGLLAAWLVMTLPFLLGLGLRWRNFEKRWRLWYLTLPVFIFGVVVLFLTRSRGAFLALVAGTFLMLIVHRKFIWLTLLALCVASIIAILPKAMIIHLDSKLQEQSIVERFSLWNRAAQVVSARPLTGTGINTYASSHAKYDKTGDWRVRGYYAHNGYLQIAAETGVTGLLLFLGFLAFYLLGAWQDIRSLPSPWERTAAFGMLAGLINFLLLAGVDTILHNQQSAMAFWFLLGALKAYTREHKTA